MKRGRGKPRALTPVEEAGVYNMHQQGKPIAEIAYKFGVSPSTVNRIVQRLKKQEKEG